MEKVCAFPECGRPMRARGYCVSHCRMLAAGGELRPVRNIVRAVDPWADEKMCTKCRVVKPQSDFYKRKDGAPRSECKRCVIEAVKKNQARRKAA